MKPLSSPLQQYWQTVVERLPEPLAEKSLSAQAKSVLTFSDFVQDSVIAHPEWLTELESQSPGRKRWLWLLKRAYCSSSAIWRRR